MNKYLNLCEAFAYLGVLSSKRCILSLVRPTEVLVFQLIFSPFLPLLLIPFFQKFHTRTYAAQLKCPHVGKTVRRPWVTPSLFLYHAPSSPQARQSDSCPFSSVPVLLIFLNRYSAIASFIAETKEALTAYRNDNHTCWSPAFQNVLIMHNRRVCFKHLVGAGFVFITGVSTTIINFFTLH